MTKEAVFQGTSFSVKFTDVDLAKAGDITIWVSRVFGHAVNASTSSNAKPCKSLPTESNPCILIVSKGGQTSQRILGGAVAALLVILLSVMIRYIAKNPHKFR